MVDFGRICCNMGLCVQRRGQSRCNLSVRAFVLVEFDDVGENGLLRCDGRLVFVLAVRTHDVIDFEGSRGYWPCNNPLTLDSKIED